MLTPKPGAGGTDVPEYPFRERLSGGHQENVKCTLALLLALFVKKGAEAAKDHCLEWAFAALFAFRALLTSESDKSSESNFELLLMGGNRGFRKRAPRPTSWCTNTHLG